MIFPLKRSLDDDTDRYGEPAAQRARIMNEEEEEEIARIYGENPRYYGFLLHQSRDDDAEFDGSQEENGMEVDPPEEQPNYIPPPEGNWDDQEHHIHFEMGRGFFIPENPDSGVDDWSPPNQMYVDDSILFISDEDISSDEESDADTVIPYSSSDESGYEGHLGRR